MQDLWLVFDDKHGLRAGRRPSCWHIIGAFDLTYETRK